jgi:hypothetical protein
MKKQFDIIGDILVWNNAGLSAEQRVLIRLTRHFAIKFGRAFRADNQHKIGKTKFLKNKKPEVWTETTKRSHALFCKVYNLALKKGVRGLADDNVIQRCYWI